MKQTIKVIAILVIVTSFSPLYSMESLSQPVCSLIMDGLENINPLSNMKELFRLSGCCKTNYFSIPDAGLAMKLAAIKFLTKPNSEILEAISTAISLGEPLASNHYFKQYAGEQSLTILTRSSPSSVFDTITN